MSRLVPYPLLVVGLVLMWLILTRFSLGHLLLGTGIAVVAGWAMGALEPERPRLRRWSAIPVLMGIVAWDILRSNVAVARLVLSEGRGARRSGFLRVPLRLRHPSALAVLAIIVTATPGTAWVEYDADTGVLLLHVFDLVDEAGWRDLIQNRYEARLLEIFG
ncbi:Na(+) H(+) antiporter subunit E [Rubellimicrobium mesophilum DSM 19309]|uniref:Na(+) H(+) antiporter subunit E n=1 Tax=Rubellimicrobium mesophilum DSM 19309 TaxID=442562 RepID=A0A017HI90_9RHOB|nr:Na+/H+ antiporter subunit E [Rubellimicrobium mesophilum]EYD74227.1 Na(+) H(+) antiporter subunit E [Rubellimicrobium mesophilum DSM 19309]